MEEELDQLQEKYRGNKIAQSVFNKSAKRNRSLLNIFGLFLLRVFRNAEDQLARKERFMSG